MTDDYAIEGEEGAYVPCDELAAVLVVEEEGAISGIATGFVAIDELAAALPTEERAAIVGSGVGFVAKPCLIADILTGFRGTLILEASAMGGPTSVFSGPTYASTGVLGALWSSHDAVTDGNLGRRELERRSFISWILPLATTFVTVQGTAIAVSSGPPGVLDPPLEVTVEYEMGPVVLDPLIEPPDFDDTGTGYGGTVAYRFGDDPQVSVPIAFSASVGSIWVDTFGDYGLPGESFRLFQLSIRNVSTVGIGDRTRAAAPGYPDGQEIEILDRFPDNPDWRLGFDPPPFDYVDVSEPESGVNVDLEVFYS